MRRVTWLISVAINVVVANLPGSSYTVGDVVVDAMSAALVLAMHWTLTHE